MSEVTDFQERMAAIPDYWCGYLASAIERALDDLGGEEVTVRQVRQQLRTDLEAHRTSAYTTAQKRRGYVVRAADGETWALCLTVGDAQGKLADARARVNEAVDCAHPDAPAWAAEKEPFTVESVTREEWDRILEDGVPELDREG